MYDPLVSALTVSCMTHSTLLAPGTHVSIPHLDRTGTIGDVLNQQDVRYSENGSDSEVRTVTTYEVHLAGGGVRPVHDRPGFIVVLPWAPE
jgi:hypothetical protein